MKIPTRFVLALSGLAVALLASARSDATTCLRRPSTLADDYANAAGIVVAQVSGCAYGALPINGACPANVYETNARAHLNVLEVLKDSVPPRDFSGVYEGAGPMGCGIPLTPGRSYLLFISESGSINHGASGALKQKMARTRELQQKLGILRDYRDGKIDELAEPWVFVDSGLWCELRHAVRDQQIKFSYQYFQGNILEHPLQPDYDEDGHETYTTQGVNPDLASTLRFAYEYEGPEVGPNILRFAVSFDRNAKTVRDSATIRVGDESWKLTTGIGTLHMGHPEPPQFVTEIAQGEAANEILQAMREPRDVVARALASYFGRTPRTDDDLYVSIETRTTQIEAAAGKFLACVDGSQRRPPPAGL